jgi:hypothetical protein
MAYRLYLKGTDQVLGDVDEAQVQTLIDLFEEEDSEDRDYYVDEATLEFLRDSGADPALVALLDTHIRPGEGIEIEWREA